MQSKSIGSGVLPPPSIYSRVSVVRVADARMMKVAYVATNLMEPSGFGLDLEQRAARVV